MKTTIMMFFLDYNDNRINADAILSDQRIYDSNDINFRGDCINLDY